MLLGTLGTPKRMEPLPEVRASLDRLSALMGGGMDLSAYLDAVARVAEAVIPSCIGVSITIVINGDAFTIAATTPEAAQLDAAQNLGNEGPCLDAVRQGDAVEVQDLLDERRWQIFQQAAAADGVRSTLSFPIRDVDDMISGGMNLYASDPNAFSDKARHIEVVFAADLSEVVANADMSFMTRDFARQLPQRLDAMEKVEQAVGALTHLRGWRPDEARSRLSGAARQAGTPIDKVADVVLALNPDQG